MPENLKSIDLTSDKDFIEEIRRLVAFMRQMHPERFGDYRILQKGETVEEEYVLELIHSVNTMFHHSDSDIIQGNWMFLVPPGETFEGDDRVVARICLDDVRNAVMERGRWEDGLDMIIEAADKVSRIGQSVVKQSLVNSTDEDVLPKLFLRIAPIKKVDRGQSVYRQVGDLAIAPCVIISNEEGQLISRYMVNSELEVVGKTTDELIDIAIENTRKIFPPLYIAMGPTQEETKAYPDVRSIPKNSGICISNDKFTYGTSSLMYPGVMQDIYDAIGEYWILFANEDQVHIFTKKDKKYTQMKNILASYRKFMTQTPPISDMVFTFVPGKGLVAYTPA